MANIFNTLLGVTVTDTNGGQLPSNYIHPENELPEKFRPSILNYKTQDEKEYQIYERVAKAFTKQNVSYLWGLWKSESERSYNKTGNKDHIRRYENVPGWLVKVTRSDLDFGGDANIYRVRKAEKVARIIKKQNLGHLVTVPKKYLYFISEKKTWAVVAEKLKVRECKNPRKIPLTPLQARAVAIIAMEACMVDLHGGNIAFDRQGRVALIDTEPTTRKMVKELRNLGIVKWKILDIKTVKFALGLQGTTVLKAFTTNPLAKREITKVQHKYFGSFLLKTVLKVAACALAIFLLVTFSPSLLLTVPLSIGLGLKITVEMITLLFISTMMKPPRQPQRDEFEELAAALMQV